MAWNETTWIERDATRKKLYQKFWHRDVKPGLPAPTCFVANDPEDFTNKPGRPKELPVVFLHAELADASREGLAYAAKKRYGEANTVLKIQSMLYDVVGSKRKALGRKAEYTGVYRDPFARVGSVCIEPVHVGNWCGPEPEPLFLEREPELTEQQTEQLAAIDSVIENHTEEWICNLIRLGHQPKKIGKELGIPASTVRETIKSIRERAKVLVSA